VNANKTTLRWFFFAHVSHTPKIITFVLTFEITFVIIHINAATNPRSVDCLVIAPTGSLKTYRMNWRTQLKAPCPLSLPGRT
jgi:hypothetical protein